MLKYYKTKRNVTDWEALKNKWSFFEDCLNLLPAIMIMTLIFIAWLYLQLVKWLTLLSQTTFFKLYGERNRVYHTVVSLTICQMSPTAVWFGNPWADFICFWETALLGETRWIAFNEMNQKVFQATSRTNCIKRGW